MKLVRAAGCWGLLLGLVLSLPLRAYAQGPGAGSNLSITVANQLDLGNVITGTTVIVRPLDVRAGKYVVTAPPNTRLRLRFSLPATMTTTNGTLAVTFDARSAAWSTQNQAAGSTVFNPATDTDVVVPSTRQIYIWLGAQLSPPSQQQAGSYSGAVTLTAIRL